VQEVDVRTRPVDSTASQLRGQLPSVQKEPILTQSNRYFTKRRVCVATQIGRDGYRVDVGCQVGPASCPSLNQGRQLGVHPGRLVE
jgi:hypothetical protein